MSVRHPLSFPKEMLKPIQSFIVLNIFFIECFVKRLQIETSIYYIKRKRKDDVYYYYSLPNLFFKMLKPIWLLFLCILLYVTIVSSTEDIHKRKNCHDEDDESKKTIIRTGNKTASTSTIREHKITVILATIADKTTTSTSINEPTHKASEDHFYDCDDERACDHSCTDNPCGHTCKDGPCHVVCIYRTRKLFVSNTSTKY